MGNFASSHLHASDAVHHHGDSGGGASETAHDRYRRLAREMEVKRQQCSAASQAAYHAKRHDEAAAQSARAKRYAAERDALHQRAADATFLFYNPTYRITDASSLHQLDLHGLTIHEAINKTKTHVRVCRQFQMTETTLITGKGLHSADGKARVRPALEQFCRDEAIGAVIDPQNGGRIILTLTAASTKKRGLRIGWLDWRDTPCLLM